MPIFQNCIMGDTPISKVVELCQELGLRWQGKNIVKHVWQDIREMVPYSTNQAINSLVADIAEMYPGLDTMRVLGKICKTTTGFVKGGFLVEEFQEMRAPLLALRWALEFLYNALLFGDMEKKECSTNSLVGDRMADVGSIQVFIFKMQLFDATWTFKMS